MVISSLYRWATEHCQKRIREIELRGGKKDFERRKRSWDISQSSRMNWYTKT